MEVLLSLCFTNFFPNADMFEVKDVGKLLDEVVGSGLLADDDQIVDVAENREVVAYTNAPVAFKLLKMKLCKCCAQMLLPLCASHIRPC